jgi:hypothetical protein
MRTASPRFAALAAACALALAGCASTDTKDEYAEEPAPVAEPEVVAEPAPAPEPVRTRPVPATPAPGESQEIVGVQACDDFLATYKACHTVIGAYDAVTLERRYEEMRSALIKQSRDPDIAPDLEARCAGLATQRDEALRGRACIAVVDEDDDTLLDDDDD